MMLFLISFLTIIQVLGAYFNSPTQDGFCSNGNTPGEDCKLVISYGYRCAQEGSWCERINGTQKCCSKVVTPCRDVSSFCRFTKSLCDVRRRESWTQLKRTCAKTCNLCNFDTYDDFILAKTTEANETEHCVEDKVTGLRKCVFPKEKMLNASSRGVVRKTVPISEKLKNFAQKRKDTPVNDESDVEASGEEPDVLINEVSATDDYEMRKEQLELLMSRNSTLPDVATGKGHKMTLSLTKTIIKGRCYDRYLYCREFESLCTHPTFSDVMAQHCALTCDQCSSVENIANSNETERCYDITNDCNTYTDLCQKPKYERLMKEYCPRACGLCVPTCRDRHLNCANFAKDDFCTDEAYTLDERKFLCGQTCKLCPR